MVKNKIHTVSGITEAQLKILTRVMTDVFEFSNYIWVINPVLGKIQFGLYNYQKVVLYYFLKHRFNIVLKFRQAGLTELIAMYCLWLAMYHDNKNIQIISIKDRVAKKVLRKIKFMYKNLPDYLKVPVVNGKASEYGTQTEMEFSNGSMITSIPTTEDAGRSEAVSLLVIDEAAIVKWANTIWAAALPTLSTGGSAIMNSTPFGMGNLFHKTFTESLQGLNSFNPIRLFWNMHPDRDMDWYNTMRENLGPRRTAQEIDGDFLSSGFTVFDLGDLREIEELIPTYEVEEKRYNNSLIIYRYPKPNELCYIGSDVSTGRSRDYSTFSIYARGGEELGCFKAKVSTGKLADILMETGKLMNNALLAPESNDVGLAVTTKIQDSGYPNLYYTTQWLKEKGEKKLKAKKVPGWLTTSQNRTPIIDELEEDIRMCNIECKNPFLVQEGYTFIYDSANRPVALGKESRSRGDEGEEEDNYTDDAIFGEAIANHIRKGKINSVVIAPK